MQITFGKAGHVTSSLEDSKTAVGSGALENEAILRGPSSAVRELKVKIDVFVEEERQNDLERGHVTTFEFPQKYVNILIGKKGENIKKYREDFDLDIQVSDGKVEIKGPKAKADLAKSRILSLCKKLEDEATHVLKIKPQYHRDLIGAKGSQVNRLQLRYNVRIQFPRSTHAAGDDTDARPVHLRHQRAAVLVRRRHPQRLPRRRLLGRRVRLHRLQHHFLAAVGDPPSRR